MITADQLYQATNNGLDIITLHFPEARRCAETKGHFKYRPSERTPSASVRLYPSQSGQKIWKVTDFGGEGVALSPIDIHMEANNFNFSEALHDLAAIFNVADNSVRPENRPDIRKQPATPEQEDGQTYWEIDQDFTEAECRIMGPRVKPETLKALNWYRVKHLVSVKNREAVYKYSNDHYPIFMRECWFEENGKQDRFFKIYEPCNYDKRWRFQYQPRDKKPQRYTNGLYEVRKAWVDYNERECSKYEIDNGTDEGYKEKKLPEVIICSGERDSLCVRSLGYHPVWFNSETYRVSEEEINELRKYAEVIYNIPDIDDTGVTKGTQLALRFMDIRTVWLPEKLKNFRDARGNCRKDFRDWMELHQNNKDFRQLLNSADPAQFWTVTYNQKSGVARYSLKLSCLHTFLRLNGIHALHEEHAADTKFVKITNNVVKQISSREIRAFVVKWAYESGQPEELRSMILTTTYLGAASLGESLSEVDPDFSNATPTSQFFYFPGFAIEVTAKEFIKHDMRSNPSGRHCWESSVIDHAIKLSEPMFEVSRSGDGLHSEDYSLDIKNTASPFLCYLINSSRLFWRKELEYNWSDEQEAAKYRREYKFEIAGPRLSEEEIQQQKQCLLSKIFCIGYLCHRYKMLSRAWAPFAMDNLVGNSDECNGRSGKSVLFALLAKILKRVPLNGRNKDLLKNEHVFMQVDRHTDMVVVDDCCPELKIGDFYNYITGDMTINPKNSGIYTLEFADSPKFIFSTNYVPRDFSPSSRQRLLFLVFGDYYHAQAETNDYLENRSVHDDFGKDLMSSEYTEKEWEADLNFILQCTKFYLSLLRLNVKIEPNLDNIIFRKHLNDMSDSFRDWAETYFAKGSEHLDTFIIRAEAFEDYKRSSGVKSTPMASFTKALKGFCYTCPYIDELNPKEFHNSGTRILKRVDWENEKKQMEMLYIRTKPEPIDEHKPEPQPERSIFDAKDAANWVSYEEWEKEHNNK